MNSPPEVIGVRQRKDCRRLAIETGRDDDTPAPARYLRQAVKTSALLIDRLWRRRIRAGVILLYHRVTELTSDPWRLCVSPDNFRQHMQLLRETCHPVSLFELPVVLKCKRTPRLPVAVTFDDGYADNLHHALPVLQHFEIPATFFLTTDFLEQPGEFWWDELERIFLQPGWLPQSLRLTLDTGSDTWCLGDGADYNVEQADRHRRWCAWEQPPTVRHAVYHAVWKRLYELSPEQRQAVLDEIFEWAGTERVERSTHRRLSPTEVVALARGHLVEIGAHTVNHPALPRLSLAAQQREIEGSKATLEDLLGRPVTSFAYPHGDCNGETIGPVRQAGFSRACTTRADPVRKGHDCFQLPRYYVGDWDGDEFARRLSGWRDSCL